ncbi:hypothetical protein NGA_2051500, partial [Nannochloropsis gaditana CCMP526]|uniref:uncharacterized protein n=1 Tax=Nannochloropsis gaditana (strain CCMP526) TaxID=1093141 RepID=UPI00029F4F61
PGMDVSVALRLFSGRCCLRLGLAGGIHVREISTFPPRRKILGWRHVLVPVSSPPGCLRDDHAEGEVHRHPQPRPDRRVEGVDAVYVPPVPLLQSGRGV